MVGLVTPVVVRKLSRGYHRVRASTEMHPPNFRPEDINFFTLNQWSPSRRLQSSQVKVEFDDRQWQQDWCDQAILGQLADDVEDKGGPSSTLRGMEIDHRESDRGQTLRLIFAPSKYGDLIAVGRYFRDEHERIRTVMERLAKEDMSSMIATAPSSVVAINMTVTSADDKLLAVRRSAAVQTSQNVWTLGPNETMLGATGASGGVEAPRHLAFRCLHEELQLDEEDVEKLEISWIGYNVPGALVHIVGHARSQLRSNQLEEGLRQSQGAFEVDDVQWLPATARTVHGILKAVRKAPFANGKPAMRWLDSAGLAAAEWWRWRRVIGG
jgi:hypothetical protein